MSNEYAVAIFQFPVVILLLLFMLWRLKLWTRNTLWRYVAAALALYMAYLSSLIVFLTGLISRFHWFNSAQSMQMEKIIESNLAPYLGFLGTLIFIIPMLAYTLLLIGDGKFSKTKKREQLRGIFSTADSIIVSVLFLPGIMKLGGYNQLVAPTGSFGMRIVFTIAITGLLTFTIFYKVYRLSQLINNGRIWWIIPVEWAFLTLTYAAPLMFGA